MIPAAWSQSVKAPPRRVLVARDEVAARIQGIWLPQGYRTHTRRAVATIVDIHPTCGEFGCALGDRVILAPSAGKKIVFGYTKAEEIEMWLIQPQAILAIIRDGEAIHGPTSEGADEEWVRSHGPEDEPRFDEGDPRGLR